MLMKLTDREWKEFKVGNLFEIGKCKCSNVSLFKKGSIPYIGATNKNNGTISFIDSGKKYITKGNCIVFICDGQGSVGYSIYKKENFVGSTTLKVGRNLLLNKYNALFFTTALDKNRSIYSYGYKRNENRLKNEHILLPITSKGEPDYKFMEDYVKEIMHRKRQEYIDYAQKILAGGGKTKVIQSLMNKKWKAFKISDIFEIFAGKRLENKNQIIGNIPFIGATDSNNGITNFVSNKNTSFDNNVLGINYNGSICEAFYHPYKCIFSDDVKRLHLKNSRNTENVLLFFSSIIKKQKEKYRYAYKFNTERMKKQYIMLPVDDKGNPDYEYMEYYTQNKMFAKYNDYLQYANNLE